MVMKGSPDMVQWQQRGLDIQTIQNPCLVAADFYNWPQRLISPHISLSSGH